MTPEEEEALYEHVANEMKRGERREGLWLKAMADSGMDETKAKAAYTKARVKSLYREARERIRVAKAKEADAKARRKSLEREAMARWESLQREVRERIQLESNREEEAALRAQSAARDQYVAARNERIEFLREKSGLALKRIIVWAIVTWAVGFAGYLYYMKLSVSSAPAFAVISLPFLLVIVGLVYAGIPNKERKELAMLEKEIRRENKYWQRIFAGIVICISLCGYIAYLIFRIDL